MQVDLVNGLFEAIGALFVWRNFVQLRRDGEVKGVYWPVTAFFAAWGVWNLYYYPTLGQWFSFSAGVVLCAGNIAWVIGVLRLRARKNAKQGETT